jgi:hypothetical protein
VTRRARGREAVRTPTQRGAGRRGGGIQRAPGDRQRRRRKRICCSTANNLCGKNFVSADPTTGAGPVARR